MGKHRKSIKCSFFKIVRPRKLDKISWVGPLFVAMVSLVEGASVSQRLPDEAINKIKECDCQGIFSRTGRGQGQGLQPLLGPEVFL